MNGTYDPQYLGFCINLIIAQAGELLTNSCQQKLLKQLMPLMVTTMMPAPAPPKAPTGHQDHHPRRFDAAISTVQWF